MVVLIFDTEIGHLSEHHIIVKFCTQKVLPIGPVRDIMSMGNYFVGTFL